MCGICGKIRLGGKTVDPDLIRTMCRALSHRGPDGEGVYTRPPLADDSVPVSIGLGHRRLSIIDLSTAGTQPMTNEDGTIRVVFNGEIYNHTELRNHLIRKGHRFRSATDTEVILHLYEEHGLSAVRQLNGMFAFALWDENRKRLWVCRDRIGIKPLVWYFDGKRFLFGSEIKALLCDPAVHKTLDTEALQLYLAFNYVPAPHTMFNRIRKLEPAHFLVLENGTLSKQSYWSIPRRPDPDLAAGPSHNREQIFRNRLFAALDRAVGDRMVADVPLGAFLSGGIDSSIVVALLARRSSGPVKTFSIGFKDDPMFDETRYARLVARKYRTDHHEFKLTYRHMLDHLDHVLSMFDEPFADSSAIPAFIVSRQTRNHVTVALSGDGGDELFAGYRSYLGEYGYRYYRKIPRVVRKRMIAPFFHRLPDSRDHLILEYVRRIKKFLAGTQGSFAERIFAWKEIMPRAIRRDLLLKTADNKADPDTDIALSRLKSALDINAGDPINRILHADVLDSLPCDMLTKVDWMSMRNALEVRVPFLDHRVVELAFSMPGNLKIKNGKTKYILKSTFGRLLPPELLRRPKAGFEVPIGRWLKTDLKFLVDTYLAKDRIDKQGIFDYRTISELVDTHMNGRSDTGWMLWNLIVFQHWYGLYMG